MVWREGNPWPPSNYQAGITHTTVTHYEKTTKISQYLQPGILKHNFREMFGLFFKRKTKEKRQGSCRGTKSLQHWDLVTKNDTPAEIQVKQNALKLTSNR